MKVKFNLFFITFIMSIIILIIPTIYCEQPHTLTEEQVKEIKINIFKMLDTIIQTENFRQLFGYNLFTYLYIKPKIILEFIDTLPLKVILEVSISKPEEDFSFYILELFIEYLKIKQKNFTYDIFYVSIYIYLNLYPQATVIILLFNIKTL